MTSLPIDVAHAEFARLRPALEELSPDTNEATTRLRAINTVLFEVLDWLKEDVEAEAYCRSEGYADYVCSVQGRKTLVIEAKRSGATFIMPTDALESRPYSFGFIASESKAAADALQQAIGYAATLGAHYVSITNGKQWLLTLTYVEGKELNERLVYVFESFEAIWSRFRLFWECLSKSQLTRHSVDAALRDILLRPAPAKASARIPGYPQAAKRNIFKNELSYILDYVWQLMAQDEGSKDFVENCYVNPISHDDTIALVRELLEKRAKADALLSQHDIVGIDRLPHQLAMLPTEKPFVILGQVGSGKTSFLKYLRHAALPDLLRNFIQIDLNFIDRPDGPSDLPTYVYDEIERQLLDIYGIDVKEDGFVRGVLDSELQRLKKTPRGKACLHDRARYEEVELNEIDKILENRHAYLIRVFHHLKKGRNCSIAIFMDNLDRRDPGLQEQAFLRGSAMARDWASMIFICLRPDTFHRSREGGVLDAIAPTTFTVSHPDLALVLKKRFAYAKAIACGERLSLGNFATVDGHIAVDLPNVSLLLSTCEFAARKRHGIIPMLEAVSNGNIRRMIDFSRSVLCSGNLDTKKILDIINTTGQYMIPDFEGIKALLYGQYSHYSPIESPFVNLFDILHANRAEHFLQLCILHYLSRFPSGGPTRGFAPRSDLTAYLSGLGFSLYAIDISMQTLEAKQLIAADLPSQGGGTGHRHYRLTSLGSFHLHHLISVFQYVDAMTLDTPVLDAAVREAIGDVSTIEERLARTRAFIGYLDGAIADIADEVIVSYWAEQSALARKGMEEIEERISS